MTSKLKLQAEMVGIRDPLMPDEWIYHKDSDYNEVLGFIREDYDLMRQEAQREDGIDSIAQVTANSKDNI